jgi:hypothetical protein
MGLITGLVAGLLIGMSAGIMIGCALCRIRFDDGDG